RRRGARKRKSVAAEQMLEDNVERIMTRVIEMSGLSDIVIASEAKQSHFTCSCASGVDCFVALRAPRNEKARRVGKGAWHGPSAWTKSRMRRAHADGALRVGTARAIVCARGRSAAARLCPPSIPPSRGIT